MKKPIALFVALISISGSAVAYPSMRSETAGSALFIYVSNPEDRAYNCTIAYDWAYDSYGELKTGSESFSVNVGAKQGEFQAHRYSGSYPHLRFTSGPTINCNPS